MQQPAHKPAKSAMQAKPTQQYASPNLGCRDLRSTLEWLRAQGDLIETEKEVDPDLEVTGLQKHMDGGCPVLFHNVKGKPNHRVVTNLWRHQRHQQDVRLEERRRAHPRHCGGVPQA